MCDCCLHFGCITAWNGVTSHSPGFLLSYESACECPVCALLYRPLHSLFPPSQCSSDLFLTPFHAHHWPKSTTHRYDFTSASPMHQTSVFNLLTDRHWNVPEAASTQHVWSKIFSQYALAVLIQFWLTGATMLSRTFILKRTLPPANSYSLHRSYNWLSQEAFPHTYVRIWGLCDIVMMTI